MRICPYISSVRYARYSHTSRLCQPRPCPAKLAARPRTCASADAPPGKLAVRPRTRASGVARALYSHLITSTQTMLPILPCSPPQHCGCPRVLRRVTIHAPIHASHHFGAYNHLNSSSLFLNILFPNSFLASGRTRPRTRPRARGAIKQQVDKQYQT